MSYLQSIKKSIVILLSSCILISTLAIGASNGLTKNKEVATVLKDTARTEAVISENPKNKEKQQEKIEVKSTNLAYNIIFYLISVFIDTNPMSRPK